nr:MAG: replication associated protein [Cressdnaviricota sp.]
MTENRVVRKFVFTLNNFTEEDERRIQSNSALFKYLVYGRETAPNTGTRHLQGYGNLKKPSRFQAIKLIIGERAHIERAKGTDSQNQGYCTKDGDYYSHGEPVGQGQRTDLERVVKDINNRDYDFEKVVLENQSTYIKYHRGIRALYDVVRPVAKRDFKTQVSVIVFVGETGAGKSRTAQEIAGDGTVYYKPRGEWWDGYEQQNTVIIDDFYGWIKYDEILKICDRYPHKVPIKGGYREFSTKRIIITSNEKVDRWYKGEWFQENQIKAIMRRIDIYDYFMIINNECIRTDLLFESINLNTIMD